VRRTAVICTVVLFGMVGAAFAAVPLYRLFCQQTGYDGASRRAKARPGAILDKRITIRFDANVRDLPWDFGPDQLSQSVQIGATGLAFFHVTNRSDQTVTAHASYNVVPLGAGLYFEKLQCFCFTDQTLKPGQRADFPVVYFVDPRFASDPDTKNTPEITLSYTFFRVSKPGASATAQAVPASPTDNKPRAAIGGSPRAAL
jgi:cytochrome c oxidase assembly protein subunit 11